jgi:hypothetical protein
VVKGKDVRCQAPWRCFRFFLLILALSVGVSSAQSLVDLAKKEKERRKKNNTEATRVVTDRDLQTHGRLPETRPTTTPTEGTEDQATAGEEGEGQDEEQDETRTREYWQNRVEGVKKKIQDLEEQLNSPEMTWNEGLRTDVNPIGQRNLSRRQETEKQLAQARAELQTIQEEARRAGVPSSWVR